MINRMKLQFVIISCGVLYFVVSKMMGFGSKTATVTKSTDRGSESYESLTSLFSRMKYPPKEIKRALKKIASNQATLKSMDGVAHQFKHAFGDSTSLSKRLKTFLKSKKKNLKEASKILEYTSTIERSLQACEIIHAVSLTPKKKELELNQNAKTVRDKAIRNTELMELHHWDMQHDNLKWKVSLLVPINATLSQPLLPSTTSSYEKQKLTNKKIEKDPVTELSKYDTNELIIVISDVKMYQQASYTDKQHQKFEKNVVNLLKLMNDKETDYLPLKSSGLVEEDITIHKTILTLAIQIILKIYPYILAYNEEQVSYSNSTLLNNNSTCITTTNIDVDDFDDSSNSDSNDNSDKMNNAITNNTFSSSTFVITTATTRHLKYSSIRVLGYSLGASVGSYIAMILDGSLNVTFPEYVYASDDKEDSQHGSIKDDIFSDSNSDSSSDNSDDDNANDNNNSDRKSVKNMKASELKLKQKTKKKSKSSQSNSSRRSRKSARGIVDDQVENDVFESKNVNDKNNSDKTNNDNHDADNRIIYDPSIETDTNASTNIDIPQNATITTIANTNINDKKEIIKSLIGLYTKKVQCICISPVPCISRAIIPQYISSVICGDDIVPRATPQTIQKLKKRLLEALKSGAGKSSISWNLGGAWLSDAKFLAGNSINQYASGTHDTSSLTVPGRVFYVKKRSLNKGGSIQRVFRGNWREDVLWLLHEVLLSSKMMSHHDLIYCAQVLARV